MMEPAPFTCTAGRQQHLIGSRKSPLMSAWWASATNWYRFR